MKPQLDLLILELGLVRIVRLAKRILYLFFKTIFYIALIAIISIVIFATVELKPIIDQVKANFDFIIR